MRGLTSPMEGCCRFSLPVKHSYSSPAMWALRGPTSVIFPAPIWIMLPPATASVRTSSERRYVLCPPTWAFSIMTFPFLMTEISTLVPPTSKKMPSEIFSYMSAPATPAARPDSMVRIGRFRTSSMLITPPSQRMIISCEVIPASLTACSVILAVSIIFGIRLALTTAVRVRVFSPYSWEISCPPVAYTPRLRAASITRSSLAGSSTL
ncbi:hypothetical protein D3C73_1139250 [compost metagenome]